MIAAPHHIVTVEAYHRMIAAGVFAAGERVELIDGELLTMSPMGNRHWTAVMELADQLTRAIDRRFIVGVQGPIILGDHDEPEPDLCIAQRAKRKPVAADVRLAVEVADTSLDFDRSIKIPRYGKAGIPEAWLIDLTEDRIEVYTGPSPAGYAERRMVSMGGTLLLPGTDVPLSWELLARPS